MGFFLRGKRVVVEIGPWRGYHGVTVERQRSSMGKIGVLLDEGLEIRVMGYQLVAEDDWGDLPLSGDPCIILVHEE